MCFLRHIVYVPVENLWKTIGYASIRIKSL